MIVHKNKFLNKEIPRNIILYGGAGHAMQVRPIIEYYGAKIIAIIDDAPNLASPFSDIPIFYGYESFTAFYKTKDSCDTGFCITIGNPHGNIRLQLHDKLTNDGFIHISIAHETAWINEDVSIGPGSLILEGAIVSARVIIGKQCIINSNATVHHECVLRDGVEIGPSSTVCGIVNIGSNSWVGAGSTVIERTKIGNNAMIGIGSVCLSDVQDGVTVIGNPARPFLKKQ
jgi:sugar O-acyltransferase (sialic acid O-acetyltransferase NeuD family)